MKENSQNIDQQNSNLPQNYLENKKIMADISPVSKESSNSQQGFKQRLSIEKPINFKDRAQIKLPMLQPLRQLQEQIIRRQQKVNESIEEFKKNNPSSSQSIERPSTKLIIGNEIMINDLNNQIGSPNMRSIHSLNTPLATNTPKSSYIGTPFPLINQQNNISKMNSPQLRKRTVTGTSPANPLTPTIEEQDSTLSSKSIANNVEQSKQKKTKKIQNIFKVITMINKKLKIKKKDKDNEFFKRYIKEYENFDTYFNVRQVFQSLNPLNNINSPLPKKNVDFSSLSPSEQQALRAAIEQEKQEQQEKLKQKQEFINEEEEDNSSSEENTQEKELYSSAVEGKSAFYHSSQGGQKGKRLFKEILKIDRSINTDDINQKQLNKQSPKKKSKNQFQTEKENSKEFFFNILQTLKSSYLGENSVIKEGDEMETNQFYSNLYDELTKQLDQEANQQEKSDELNQFQEREIERINSYIKKIHEQSEKMNKLAIMQNQHILENKYQEFKKKSDQAIKLIRKGGYQIYKSKIKYIEDQGKRNIQLLDTLQNFEEFNKKLKFKPLHHQHFSQKRERIQSVQDIKSAQNIPTNNNGQTLNKQETINSKNNQKRQNFIAGKNSNSIQLQNQTQSIDMQRRLSLHSNSQIIQNEIQISPRKTKDFDNLKNSPRYSRNTFDSKDSPRNQKEVYVTSVHIEDQSQGSNFQASDQFKKLNLDMKKINQSSIDSNGFNQRMLNSQKSILKKSSSNNSSQNDDQDQHKQMAFSTISQRQNKLPKQSSFTINNGSNTIPSTQNNQLIKQDSQIGFISPKNHINYRQKSFSNAHSSPKNGMLNKLNSMQSSPRNQVISRFNSQQVSPKNSSQNDKINQQLSPQNLQIDKVKNNNVRRQSLQHKSMFISNQSDLANKLVRMNSLHEHEKQNPLVNQNNITTPKMSSFQKQMNTTPLQQEKAKKVKSLINKIFQQPDMAESDLIKEEFFPSKEFVKQKSYVNISDIFYQKHNAFCQAVEKRNKQKLNQYKQMQQESIRFSQSQNNSNQNFFQGSSQQSIKIPQRSQQSTFYSSKSPLIILKDQLKKATPFQQKYSNKVQTILYDLDFVQEENSQVKNQMVKTVQDSYKSFEYIMRENYPNLECLKELQEASAVENKNKKPFIQKNKSKNEHS